MVLRRMALLVCGLAAAALGWLARPAQAGEVPAELADEVRRAVTAEAKARIDEPAICRELGLSYPVPEISKSRAEIEAEIERVATQAQAEASPASLEETLRQEAEARFPLCKQGDKVTVQLVRGDPHSGTFTRTAPGRVQVGSRWISLGDIADASLANLVPEANTKAIERYVRAETLKRKVRAEDAAQQARDEAGKRLYPEAGYAKSGGKWHPQRELVTAKVEAQQRLWSERLQPEIAARILKEHGYELHDGAWAKPKPEPPAAPAAPPAVAAAPPVTPPAAPEPGDPPPTAPAPAPTAPSAAESPPAPVAVTSPPTSPAVAADSAPSAPAAPPAPRATTQRTDASGMFLAEDDADGAAAAEPVTVVLKPSATPRPEHAAPGAGEDEQGEADEDDADEGEDAERVAAVAVAAAAELATSARSGPSWPARLIGYAMVGVSLLVVLLVQGLAYWLMGKVTGVPAGILPCLLAALAATLVRGGLQLCGLGLFLGAPAAALVACGVLYKWSDAQTFIDVFFIVAVGNAIMEAMFMFGMAWVAGMAMGAAASLSSL